MTHTDPRAPARFESGIMPASELYSRIRAAIDAEPASLVSTRTRITFALAAVLCAAAAALVLASQIVYQRQAVGLEVGGQVPGHALLMLFLLAILVLAATFVALRRSPTDSETPSLKLAVILVLPIYAVVTLAFPLHGADPLPPDVPLSWWGARCITLSAIVGILVLLCFTMALRRAVPVASVLRGAVLGAAAGAWAGLTVFVFCPAGEAQHLLLGHVLPVALSTLLGTIAAPRALRP